MSTERRYNDADTEKTPPVSGQTPVPAPLRPQ